MTGNVERESMMRILRAWFARLGGLFDKNRRDRELAAELEIHLRMHIEDNLREGMTPDEARRQALVRLGGVEQTKESCREQRGFPWLESLLQDVRFGLRMLRKNPGFTAIAVLITALGIGANTAIFSLIDAVMLRSLPVEKPSQLFVAKWTARQAPRIQGYQTAGECLADLYRHASNPSGCSLSEPMFRRIAQMPVFSEVAAFGSAGNFVSLGLDLTGNGAPSVVVGQVVSGNFFRTLGVDRAAGRLIQESDDLPSAPSVAVLSYGYWQTAFGGSPDAIGRTIELNRVPFTIVGVVEQRFTGLAPGSSYDIWLPLADAQRITDPLYWQNLQDDPSMWWLTVVVRLEPGTSLPVAQAAASAAFRNDVLYGSTPLFHALGGPAPTKPGELSGSDDNPTLTLVDAQNGLEGGRPQYSSPLYVLMAAVAIILLIACTNVAGLILARSAAREREIAVRLALGARPMRIVRQLLTESVMLSTLGGILGIVCAYWGTHAILSFVSQNQPRPLGFATGVDMRIVAFTAAMSVGAGIFFGVAPALRSARVDVTPALKEGTTSLSGEGRTRGQWLSTGNALVAAQVALAMIMLVGAGLLVRTLQNLRSVDPGFDSQNVLLFNVDPMLAGYKENQIDSFYRDLQGRLAEIPGVASASYSRLPLLSNGGMITAFHWPGTPQDRMSPASALAVGRDFFRTMRIPLLQGRDFNDSDYAISPRVGMSHGPAPAKPVPVIVNQSFIGKYLGKDLALGKRFGESAGSRFGPPSAGYEIVGVVRDAKYENLRQEIAPTMYLPLNRGGAAFELRAAAEPKALLAAVRTVIEQIDPNLPLSDIMTQATQIDRLLFQERLVARLSVFFGLLALALACIGLYGLLSYEVTRRTREIGIRVALGAAREDVLYLVVKQGLAVSICGASLGMGAAFGATRFLKSMLYGVQANDPLTVGAAAFLLVFIAFAACWIPAWRAMCVDPMVALRYE